MQYLQTFGATVHGAGWLRRHRLVGDTRLVAEAESVVHWSRVVRGFVAELADQSTI